MSNAISAKPRNLALRALCEGAIFTAMALVLSYFKLDLWYQGGSVDLVMLPLLVYALRWGAPRGMAVGFVFGLLKFFLANGWAISWTSILLDYSVAYAAVGLAGLLRAAKGGVVLGTLLGCAVRFVVHFISGVTIYAIVAPTEQFGVTYTSAALFSAVYNATYMLPNTVLAVLLCALLTRPLGRYFRREDIR